MVEILGYVATFLICVAYVPQVFQVVRTKKVEALSIEMFIVLIVSGTLWTIYGCLIKSTPIIVCNVINLIQSAIILGYKIKYK